MTSDAKHVWVVDSLTDTVVEFAAGSGRSDDGDEGQAPTDSDGPLAITTDGEHVWIASSRSNSLTEVNAESGAFIRFLHGAQYGLSVVSAITSSGGDVWVTNLGTSGPKGTSVSEITPPRPERW
jgi:DNA-binding beta-propeller fold protein YncE